MHLILRSLPAEESEPPSRSRRRSRLHCEQLWVPLRILLVPLSFKSTVARDDSDILSSKLDKIEACFKPTDTCPGEITQ
jgi:hypothetical protein